MLKTYSKENYGSFAEFKKLLAEELKQAFIGTKVSVRGKDAYITDFYCSVSNLGETIMTTLDVNGSLTSYAINLAVKNNIIKFEGDACDAFNSYLNIYEESIKTNEAEEKEAVRLAAERAKAYQAELAAKKARLEEERKAADLEARYNKKVQRALTKLKSLKPENTSKLFEAPQSQYEIIGWMAKHSTGIKAAMPDYMEKWFVGRFGDVERYVVDSRKKTSGGFDYQWSLGLKISFDQDVLGPLELKATSKNKKVIDSVTFVWDLIENYGFQFGKAQNIDLIKQEVPEKYLQDFEKGYAM